MQIRQATLDDTRAISDLFRRRIERWQRMNPSGQVDDLPYAELTIYERWLHGGPWMSLETAALWLSHLNQQGVQLLVLEDDGYLRGYAEAYPGDEPEPFGRHWHIGQLITVPDDDTARDALLQALLDRAQDIGRITASCTAHDRATQNFYKRYAFHDVENVQQVQVSAQVGSVGFYQVTDHAPADYEQLTGWRMPLGRTQSARQHWEEQWPALWQSMPRMSERRTHRLHMSASGQVAFVCFQQQLYNPRSVRVYCWTPKPLSSQLLNAIRDRAYKEGYRTLILDVSESIAEMLGDHEDTPRQQQLFLRSIQNQ
jgi:GNAT superfamily N-acetyltransferase